MKYRALLVAHLNGEHGSTVKGDEPINELEKRHGELIHRKLGLFPQILLRRKNA